MLQYSPIVAWSGLPAGAPRDVAESMALDFKAEHGQDAAEDAKDIAAFANALGGTILVGVAERADSYERKLMPVELARSVARSYEDAARDLLAPVPMVDAAVITFAGNAELALVAVNVEPFPGQLVGARVPGTDAWRFPVRTASRHTRFLDPVHTMIHSEPKARKAAILLSSIPVAQRKLLQVQVMERYEMEIQGNQEEVLDGELVDVSAATNTVALKAFVSDRSEIVSFGVPLEDVEAVWKSQGGWATRLDGALVFRRGPDGHRYIRYLSGRGPYNWG